MFETERRINQFLMNYVKMLTDDVPDERFAEQPLPGVNHPAWILGHLAIAGDGLAALSGGAKSCPESWATLFGRGSQMTSVRSDYPTKAELCDTLAARYQTACELAANAAPEQLARPNPNRLLRDALPTVGDACAFLMTGHFSLHLGQLSAWRRMLGMSPLF